MFAEPLEQLPCKAEAAGVAQLTVSLADNVVYEPENDPSVFDVLYLHIIADPEDTDSVTVSEPSMLTSLLDSATLKVDPSSVEYSTRK